MRFFPLRRRTIVAALATLLLGAVAVATANGYILTRHRNRVFESVATTPAREVALVLGANPVTRSGRPNLHFAYRMDAAAGLYHTGKVRHLLVSGDNHRRDYDEPTAMKEALVARGVPARSITCDYAGFRTLDSVVRAKRVFGLGSFVIVSQAYHNHRALEIAQAHGLDAVALNTRDVPALHALKTQIREVLARTATMLDLYVWHRQPRFSGPYEPILLAQK